jgi:amino acid transporter/mannitol/fructose-specific phosphotransferase system IIA component (Ntr-type)
MDNIQTTKKLKKDLSLLDVFCIASGAMISSGLFILPGIASAKVGPALFLSYIVASVFVIPTILSMAELASAMPKAGGDYFFITRSMGAAAGTVGGLATWFSLSLKSAFALLGMGAYVALVPYFHSVDIRLVAVLFCLLFMLINLKGVKHAGHIQVALVLGLIALLALYITKGFTDIDINRYKPFTPYGGGAVFAAAGFIFVSYGGLTKIASVAEEIDNPARNIPLGMFLSLIIIGLIYSMVVFITTGLLDTNQLYNTITPISDGAAVSMPGWGGILMAVGAILAFISTANAGIMSASRYPLAMSRDGLMPSLLGKINKKFNTPHFSIILTSLFMMTAIIFLPLELLVKAASVFLILIYILINLSLVIMRESKIPNYQPTFKSPLYPWVQIAGMLGCLFLIYEMGSLPILMAVIFVITGFFWYLAYGAFRTKRTSAIIHIVERLTNKELADDQLRVELKEIIQERDDISEDRFDKMIKDAIIVDLEKAMSMKKFFKLAAEKLAEKTNQEADYIYELLIQREKESSTVIRDGLAIPHIICGGKKEFYILLARCKEGIKFEKIRKPVNTVFVLAGSKDERNFHLRALSAIAQIVQEEEFEENWKNAKNLEALRDIILLAERQRMKE